MCEFLTSCARLFLQLNISRVVALVRPMPNGKGNDYMRQHLRDKVDNRIKALAGVPVVTDFASTLRGVVSALNGRDYKTAAPLFFAQSNSQASNVRCRFAVANLGDEQRGIFWF